MKLSTNRKTTDAYAVKVWQFRQGSLRDREGTAHVTATLLLRDLLEAEGEQAEAVACVAHALLYSGGYPLADGTLLDMGVWPDTL